MKNLKMLMEPTEIQSFLDQNFKTSVFKGALATVPELQTVVQKFCAKPRLIFEATDLAKERANFTSWYNALAVRDYVNPAINDLYYLHEIFHIATMPYNADLSFEAWKDKIFQNELEASVMSEAYIYFLIPKLRSKSFANEIWVDRYLNAMDPPSLTEIWKQLMSDRERIQRQPILADSQEARIHSYQKQNEEWARIWRSQYLQVEAHMCDFERLCAAHPRQAGLNHKTWIEGLIEKGKKSYPFPDEVEAFAAFCENSYKSDDAAAVATALKTKTA